MTGSQRLVAWALTAALAGCAASATPLATEYASHEPWTFEFDGRDWRLGYSQAAGSQAIREYVLPGEQVEAWSELVTSYYTAVDMPARTFHDQKVAGLARGCPSLVTAVLDESDDSLIAEWRHEGCQGYPPQHELNKLVRGLTGMFSLSFTEKTKQLSAEKRERWLGLLRAARSGP